jgi:CarboxypepD_reg-like domain/TonB-dependent Receptor Plug Domain
MCFDRFHSQISFQVHKKIKGARPLLLQKPFYYNAMKLFPSLAEKRSIAPFLVFAVVLLISSASLPRAVNAQNLQTLTVSGIVRDGATNQPLSFVTVMTKDVPSVSTNDSGFYELSLPAGSHTIRFQAVGYKSEQRIIKLGTKNAYVALNLTPLKYLLQEVSVFSRNSNNNTPDVEKSGLMSISGETVQKTSGMFKEAFRVVQTMPGVTSNNELSARFNVRGGVQDENLVLVNGTQVFEPYHAKYAAQGSISVLNIDLVEKVDIVTGGFSAEYGDRMSSVVNFTYREGARDGIHGSAGISLTNVDALLEGPIADGGSFVVGFRQSYVQLLLGLLNLGSNIRPSFYDLQGQVRYRFSPYYTMTLQFVQSGDEFRVEPNLRQQTFGGNQYFLNGSRVQWTQDNTFNSFVRSEYANTVLNLQNTFILAPTVVAKAAFAYYNQSDDESGSTQDNYNFRASPATSPPAGEPRRYFNQGFTTSSAANLVRVQTLEARLSADAQISPVFDVRVGAMYQNLTFYQDRQGNRRQVVTQNTTAYPDTVQRVQDLPIFGIAPVINLQSFKANGYIETITQLDESLLLNIGGRFDYFGVNRDLNLAPRVNAAYRAPFGTTFRAAWGLYYQSPLYSQLLYSFAADSNTKAQRATHYILGVEHRFDFDNDGNGVSLKIDAYHKQYANLMASARVTTNDAVSNSGIQYSRRNDSEGFAQGVDVFAALNASWFKGWVSYGILNARERFVGDTTGQTVPRFTDQRHTFSVVTDFRLGADWSAGVRYAFGSGFAYTPSVAVQNLQTMGWIWRAQARNSANYPAYSRLDVRIDKGFTVFGLQVFAFIDVSNVLNQRNIYAYDYSFNVDGSPLRNAVNLWPILPSFGLTVRF